MACDGSLSTDCATVKLGLPSGVLTAALPAATLTKQTTPIAANSHNQHARTRIFPPASSPTP